MAVWGGASAGSGSIGIPSACALCQFPGKLCVCVSSVLARLNSDITVDYRMNWKKDGLRTSYRDWSRPTHCNTDMSARRCSTRCKCTAQTTCWTTRWHPTTPASRTTSIKATYMSPMSEAKRTIKCRRDRTNKKIAAQCSIYFDIFLSFHSLAFLSP